MTEKRSALVEALFHLLPGVAPGPRRFLLSIKRACYNQREIRHYRKDPRWIELGYASGCLMEEVAELEACIHELDSSFEELYLREHGRERSHLLTLLDDLRFVRGIALGSPELVRKARELRRFPSKGRQHNKVEQSLARFVTRSAAKLSPYSTLTPMALGRVGDGKEALRFLETERTQEKSLLRANRSLLDQCCSILLEHPPVRARCLVSLNDSLEEVEPLRYRFLRPGRWSFDSKNGQLRFLSASQVKATLAGPIVPVVLELLEGGGASYADLPSRILARAGGYVESDVRAVVDGLISLGVLILLPPWPTYEPHLERSMLRVLSELLPDPALQPVVEVLNRLLKQESDYHQESDPGRAAEELRGTVQDLLEAVLRPWGHDPEVTYQTQGQHRLYEDVFLFPDKNEPELLELSSHTAKGLLKIARMLFRFAHLHSHRHDVMHGLAALWRTRWPERKEIGALELFFGLKDFWNSYLAFDLANRDRLFSSFNPLGLVSVHELEELRGAIYKETQDLMREGQNGWELEPALLSRLLERIPSRYLPAVDPCIFVQPATPDGDLWVLNRLFEGTGRYGSRFHAALETWTPGRYLPLLVANSVMGPAANPIYLLDLLHSQGNTSNLRFPQTSKVLEMPGERLDLPRERRVGLRDLKVRADLAGETFQLVGAQGERYLPVALSSISNIYMPVFLRFLSLFGNYEVRQVVPRPKPARRDGVVCSERLTCGNLVLRRKRWVLEEEQLGPDTAGLGPAETFTRINTWRYQKGLPEQVFLYERMNSPEGVETYKPQYIDFSSPTLAHLLHASLKGSAKRLIFEEPLPLHTSFPSGFIGQRWGLEVQIEGIGLIEDNNSVQSDPSPH